MTLLASSFPLEVARSLREGLYMLWETLWALVLGFGISGAVRTFVPSSTLRSLLGNHRPAAVARAVGYGMASSSCSYAAASVANSLFEGGADFLTSLVFMVASTNLVIELGLVMLALLGWQFTAAEFVGGPVMIVLLVAFGGLLLGPRVVATARRPARVAEPDAPTSEHCGHDLLHQADVATAKRTLPDTWAAATRSAISDFTMLRRELLVGFTVAGFLAVLVPSGFWNALFLHGHGAWTAVENALVGPLVACLSWVCSIGNVPMAAALWSRGISFGGVLAFLFADLLAMPLILVYRKLYGTRVTLRLVALLYVVMSIAGLVTELAFRGIGIVPAHRVLLTRAAQFRWDATTWLDLVALAVAAAAWWLTRRRERSHRAPPTTGGHCAMHSGGPHADASTAHDESA